VLALTSTATGCAPRARATPTSSPICFAIRQLLRESDGIGTPATALWEAAMRRIADA
jgi:hypothetical protein